MSQHTARLLHDYTDTEMVYIDIVHVGAGIKPVITCIHSGGKQ